jgi:hypothetical protein
MADPPPSPDFMTLAPVQVEERCPEPNPAGSAPFPGPEWDEEDDLSVEWDEDWAWDGEGSWEDVAGNPGGLGLDPAESAS